MKAYRLYCYLLLLTLLFPGSLLRAQHLVEAGNHLDVESYKPRVRDLIEFLEYSMNTLGDPGTPARDKNVIITQSYLKAFKDSKVQIEDDLNDNRSMVTHKDVQAYLSDIDFFFKVAKFDFMIDEISFMTNADNQGYYLVKMTRNLQGITIEDDSVNSTKTRFVEVNLNEAARDLKIASMYTTRLSEEEELNTWWARLPYPWTQIFKNQLGIDGPVDHRVLRNLVEIEKLDLSNYPKLRNLEPVSRLTNLKGIDVSGTEIDDLIPLRNLTELEFLDCSNTKITSIEPLKYSLNLRVLRLDSTRITDGNMLDAFKDLEQLSLYQTYLQTMEPISGLEKLRILNIGKTRIRSLEGIEKLKKLVFLDASFNNFKKLDPVGQLENLQHLKIDNSLVTDLSPLKELPNLRILSCNNTLITTLAPLEQVGSLERVYCDNTLMVSSEAKTFITRHPQILVVYGTESLRGWWQSLSDPWKQVLTQAADLKSNRLSREEMARVANITRVDISGMGGIKDLEPVRILKNLKELNIEATGVTDLSPLRGLLELQILEASNTGVAEMYSLEQLPKLRLVGIDNTKIRPQEITRFINRHPKCLVMYKTVRLLRWWGGLSTEWKQLLTDQLDHKNMSDKQRLHAYVNLEQLQFNHPISSLEPIKEFIKLKELSFSGSRVTDLEPLTSMQDLEVLQCSQSPIEELEPISKLRSLKKLNFEDTLVEELDPLEGLKGLNELYFSGTQVKDLKPLAGLINLKVIECYNTDVKSLKAIEGLRGLRNLKCYNTKVNHREAQSFRKAVPQCEVIHY